MRAAIRIENLKESKWAVCQGDVTIVLEVKGQADIPVVTIHDCTLRDGDKGQWLALPRRSYEGKDGTTQYFKMVGMPQHTYNAAITAMQDAWALKSEAGPVEEDGDDGDPFRDA